MTYIAVLDGERLDLAESVSADVKKLSEVQSVGVSDVVINCLVYYPCGENNCPPCAGVGGDPHLKGAHGDEADFKGENHGVYNLLSARDFSLR